MANVQNLGNILTYSDTETALVVDNYMRYVFKSSCNIKLQD